MDVESEPVPVESRTGRSSSQEFARIREAFESIVEGPGGVATLRGDFSYAAFGGRPEGKEGVPRPTAKGPLPSHHDEERNGFLHPSVDPRILHEVSEASATMSPGGLDRGGMWQYAKMIRNMAEGESLPPLRVGGDSKEENAGRVGRRRRKK